MKETKYALVIMLQKKYALVIGYIYTDHKTKEEKDRQWKENGGVLWED